MRSSSKVLIEGLSIIITYFTAASLVELEARRWIRRAYKLEQHSVDDERCFDRHQWTAQWENEIFNKLRISSFLMGQMYWAMIGKADIRGEQACQLRMR